MKWNNNPTMKIKYIGLSIIVVIVVFAFIYCGNSASIEGLDGFGSALYFSIVTITTLGFGDMFPKDGFARTMVCLEVLAGVVFVGVFLNSIAQAQTQRLQYLNEKAKLRQHYLLLSKLFEKYLQAAFYVVTPWEKQELPADILSYKFNFTFNDMADLNATPRYLSSQLNSSAVSNFFDIHDRLYQELRHTVDNVDLSYWPSLETNIHNFLQHCSDFTYKDTILTNTLITPFVNPGQSKQAIVSKLIHNHVGAFSMDPQDQTTPYAALYNMLKENTTLMQNIAVEMAKESTVG